MPMPVGGAQVEWYGEQFMAKLETHMRGSMAMACIIVQRRAKQNVETGGRSGLHVITGRLHRSIAYDIVSAWEGRVGSNVEYAAIHEYGGEAGPVSRRVHIPARPYLRPALDDMQREVTRALTRRMP